MTTISRDKIILQGMDRSFRAIFHFMIYDQAGRRGARQIIASSHVANPEAANAISAGILEGRTVELNGENYFRPGGQTKFHRIERKIGIGDLLHSMVFNTQATITGIDNTDDKKAPTTGYVIAPNGNINDAIGDHFVNRFGLPYEWRDHYPGLFRKAIEPLQVLVNKELGIWPMIQAVKISISEEEVIHIVDVALRRRALQIPPSDVQGTFIPGWKMKDYMLANSHVMAQKVAHLEPQHTVENGLVSYIGEMERVPFPAQAHMIQALSNTLKKLNSVICSGDMGTGKTIISIGTAYVLHKERMERGAERGTAILISAPGITLSKWQYKEILGTIPHAKVTIIRTHVQALQLYKEFRNGYRIPKGEIHFFLIGIDKSKMGNIPHYAGVWKRIKGEKKQYGWHCPDCGLLLKKKIGGTWFPLFWNDVAEGKPPTEEEIEAARMFGFLGVNGIPQDKKVKWLKSKKFTKCCYTKDQLKHEYEVRKLVNVDGLPIYKTFTRTTSCGAKMYRGAVRSRGETPRNPTVQISRLLKRFRKFFDLYIADEVHKSKASGTGRGDAFASMVKAAKKNLNLTGTLVNGKSSSIKEILWRTDPAALLARGFTHKTGDIHWAEKFGKIEQIIHYEEAEDGTFTRKKKKEREPVEAPGIAPHMTAEFLLHKSGFLELGDMGLPLVELKEIPIFIDMQEDHYDEYQNFHKKLYDVCARVSAQGGKGAWSKFIPSTIMYADRPDLGARVIVGENVVEAPPISGYHPKQKKLVEIVKKELAENRGIVIYNSYTQKYGMNELTKRVLAEHGIRSVILNESDTEKRAEVISDLEEKGEMVIITNMKMVEVGLDLLSWPTIINNQLTYEVSVFRQANRRNWRIGQEKECRCYVLVFNGTQQMSQFMKIMAGRGHALMTEGRLDKSDLAKFSRDSQSALASDLAACFAESDVAEAWTALAAKDLADVELISEADFKKVIEIRMKALANETRRLCGLGPIVDVVEQEDGVWGVPEEWNPFDLQVELFHFPSEVEEPDLFSFIEEPEPVEPSEQPFDLFSWDFEKESVGS